MSDSQVIPGGDPVPWRRVEATLLSLSRLIRELYDVRLAQLKISLTDASLLAYIDERGPLSQIRLAAAMGMSRSSAGVRISRLERRGLVRRDADPADARALMVRTTSGGRSLVKQIAAIDRLVRAELRSGTTRQDRLHLVRTMEAIGANVQQALRAPEA